MVVGWRPPAAALAALAAWAIGGSPTLSQDAVRVSGFVQGVTTLALQTTTTFINWDYGQPMNDTVLAVFDILSKASAGYELRIETNTVAGTQDFQYSLRYDEQPVQFSGNGALFERVASRDGLSARGKALTMSAPPQKVQNAGVDLTFVIRAP